jgi:hypothetical protein
MKHFDTIRGKKPTKTEIILEYMVEHPNEILTPKEVADGLKFNLQTTVTVLNRLALEGALSKKDRGQFYYEETEMEEELKEEKTSPIKMSNKTAAGIYKAIYLMACESAGEELVSQVTGLNQRSFDKKAPIDSIKNLVRALIDLMGKDIVDDIVSIALKREFKGERTQELKRIFYS